MQSLQRVSILVSCSACTSVLRMTEILIAETSVDFQRTIRLITLHIHGWENIMSYIDNLIYKCTGVIWNVLGNFALWLGVNLRNLKEDLQLNLNALHISAQDGRK
jgi:hypothetical protein